MKVNNGRSYYGIGLDNTQLKNDANESRNIFKNIGDKAVSEGSRIDNVYRKITSSIAAVGGTLAFSALVKDLYTFSNEFSKSMREVTTISKTVENDLDGYKERIISLTTQIPVAAGESAKALYQIVSAGHDGADGMKILEVSAKSAVGGLTETATAADGITTLLNAYKKNASEAENVSDMLFTTVRLGKTTFGELARSVAQVAPIAASYGVEMDQVLAAVASLTKSGVPTAQAMTQIRAAIIGTSKVLGDGAFKTRTLQEALAEVANKAGGSESKLRELMPEVEGVNGLLGLTGINAKAAASDLEELNNSVGASQAAFEKMAKEGENQIKLLKNNVFAEFSKLGDSMLISVGNVASALNEAFESGNIEKVINVLKVLITTYGTYKAVLIATAAIQKVSVTMGNIRAWLQLVKTIRSAKDAQIAFNIVTKANPYVLLASAIIGVVTAFIAFSKNANKAAKANAELSANIQQETRDLDILFKKLNSAKNGTDERKKSIEQINNKYGSYLENLLTEKSTVEEIASAYDDAKKKIIEYNLEKSREKYLAKPIENLGDATKDFYVSLDAFSKKLDNETQRGKFRVYVDQLVEAVKGGDYFSMDKLENAFRAARAKGNYKDTEEWLEAFRSGKEEYGGNILREIGGWDYGNLKNAGKSLEVYSKALRKAEKEFGEFSKSYTNISDLNGKKDGEDPVAISAKTNLQLIVEARKNVEKLKEELNDLRSGKGIEVGDDPKKFSDKISKKEKELADARAILDTLTGSLSESEKKKLAVQQEVNQKIIENDLALQAERISVYQDTRNKILQQIDLEEKQKIIGINQEEKDLAEKYSGKELPDGVKKGFEDRRQVAYNTATYKRAEAERDYNLEISKLYNELTDVFLSDEELKVKAIERRYDEMRRLAKDEYTNEVGVINITLSGEAKDKALENAKTVFENKNTLINAAQAREEVKDVLNTYKTFDEKRREINDRYDKERKKIEESGLRQEVISQKIEVLERARKSENKSLNNEEISSAQQNADLLVRIFTKASDMSQSRLKSTLEATKQLIHYLEGVSDVLPEGITPEIANRIKESPEQLKELYSQINDLQERYDQNTKYPFSNFIKGFSELKKSSELAKKALKETDKEKKRVLENEAELTQGKGLSFLKDGAVEAADSVAFLAEKLLELADATGDNKLKESAEQMSAVAQNFGAAAKGFQSGGWIGAIIGGATDMISQTFAAFTSAKAEDAEYKQNQLDFLNAYELLLLKIKNEDFDTVFGSNSLAKAAKASEKAREAMRQYEEEVTKRIVPSIKKEFNSLGAAIFGGLHFGSWLGLTRSKTNETKTLLAAYKKGYTDLQAMAVKTKNYSGWANFFGKKDKYKSLKDLAPQLWDDKGEFDTEAAKAFLDTNTQISEEQRKQIQNVIDLKDAYEENMEIIRNDIEDTFGNLGTAITDSLVEALKNGSEAGWKKFYEAGAASLEKLGEKLAYELFLSKKFEQLQKQLEDSYELGDPEAIGNRQMEIIDNFFSTIGTEFNNAQDFMKKWKEEAKERGFDLWEDENSREATKKGIATASQDSIDEFSGRTAVIQTHTYSISENMKILASNSTVALKHLAGIETNTGRLEGIETDISFVREKIASLKEGIDTINLKGIKLKS